MGCRERMEIGVQRLWLAALTCWICGAVEGTLDFLTCAAIRLLWVQVRANARRRLAARTP